MQDLESLRRELSERLWDTEERLRAASQEREEALKRLDSLTTAAAAAAAAASPKASRAAAAAAAARSPGGGWHQGGGNGGSGWAWGRGGSGAVSAADVAEEGRTAAAAGAGDEGDELLRSFSSMSAGAGPGGAPEGLPFSFGPPGHSDSAASGRLQLQAAEVGRMRRAAVAGPSCARWSTSGMGIGPGRCTSCRHGRCTRCRPQAGSAHVGAPPLPSRDPLP
jgi:hypothetical protein